MYTYIVYINTCVWGCVCKYFTRCASSTYRINLSHMMSPYQYTYSFIYRTIYLLTIRIQISLSLLAHISMCMHTYASQCVCVCECVRCARWMSCLDIFTSMYRYSMYVCMYISIYLAAKSATLSRSSWDPCGIDTIFFFILWCGQLTETWMRKDFWKTSLIRRRILPFFCRSDRLSLCIYICICVASNMEEQTMRIEESSSQSQGGWRWLWEDHQRHFSYHLW